MADVGTINDYVSITLSRDKAAGMSSLLQITQQLVARMNQERADVAVDYNSYDLVQANREKDKLVNFKDKVADTASLLSKTSNAINNISATLTKMRNSLDLIDSSTSAEVRAQKAAEFDADLASINSQANGANQTVNYRNFNLIGNTQDPSFSTDNVTTSYTPKGGALFVEGTYLGSDYYIQAADGNLWRHDATAGKFIEYGPDGYTKTGGEISTDGLTLTSFDNASGAITYGGTGSLSGTVVRGGLKLVGSDLYNGFADDASVAQAMADLDQAIATAASRGASIKANSALLQSNISQVSEKLLHVDKEISDLVDKQLSENGSKSAAAQAKLGLAVTNLNLASSANNALIENMLTLFGLMGF